MKIGDKVVCVDDSPCKFCGKPMLGLLKDKIYAIERFLIDHKGDLKLILIGLGPDDHGHNPNKRPFYDRTFSPCRFRLLDHLKEFNRQHQTERQTQNL